MSICNKFIFKNLNMLCYKNVFYTLLYLESNYNGTTKFE